MTTMFDLMTKTASKKKYPLVRREGYVDPRIPSRKSVYVDSKAGKFKKKKGPKFGERGKKTPPTPEGMYYDP